MVEEVRFRTCFVCNHDIHPNQLINNAGKWFCIPCFHGSNNKKTKDCTSCTNFYTLPRKTRVIEDTIITNTTTKCHEIKQIYDSQTSPISDLVIEHMITYGSNSLHDLLQFRLVSKQWMRCAQSETLWGAFRMEIISEMPNKTMTKNEKFITEFAKTPGIKTYALYMFGNLLKKSKIVSTRLTALKRMKTQTMLPLLTVDEMVERTLFFQNKKLENLALRKAILKDKQYKIGCQDSTSPTIERKRTLESKTMPLYVDDQRLSYEMNMYSSSDEEMIITHVQK